MYWGPNHWDYDVESQCHPGKAVLVKFIQLPQFRLISDGLEGMCICGDCFKCCLDFLQTKSQQLGTEKLHAGAQDLVPQVQASTSIIWSFRNDSPKCRCPNSPLTKLTKAKLILLLCWENTRQDHISSNPQPRNQA